MAPKKHVDADELMIVNDSPGEECRIAILQDGHLEELYTERTASATAVGNIYKGRVTNVEPAIQAAFIDYGEGVNGFLHISDLHPKYFPKRDGSERVERVGKKIPRRDRPPIQEALHRGDEILVQVLKEGIGTKGPTLTSYLSIPGRLLVLMPDMDRVGVSRKVEDEQKRRQMREILDSLNLPEGFGFILRTAGFDKTKTELKRDAAYLMRLWKVMEKRIQKVGAPCKLYTESDLLLRTVRDVLRPTIKTLVVDSESAYERVSAFLQVVAPRSAPKVIHYRRPVPIFHAFDIERQIELIHSREVPLPSGGRLVIDQTEALVAIDVNSGRSRSARDSETNAYETNCEAADEICRQLRLRDLGGLIVNDLIDMRSPKHRRQIEERFQANLKRDRARSTVLRISEFGILEMTRQRMRPSLRKSHFMSCPHCNGNGEIKVPEYVAADATRRIGLLLQYDRVRRVELVCSPRVASVLLSAKRRELVRLEDTSGKKVDVRVSDAIAVDRVDYYAYDDRNADIDIAKLPPLKAPSLEELEAEQAAPPVAVAEKSQAAPVTGKKKKRRRHGPADAAAIALAGGFDDDLTEEEAAEENAEIAAEKTAPAVLTAAPSASLNGEARQSEESTAREEGRRRRRRRRRKGNGNGGQQPSVSAAAEASSQSPVPAEASSAGSLNGAASSAASNAVAASPSLPTQSGSSSTAESSQEGTSKRKRRRKRRRHSDQQHSTTENAAAVASGDTGESHVRSEAEFESTSDVVTDSATQPSNATDQPVRVHELAKELQVSSREVIERCEPEPGIPPITSPLASVTAEEAERIRRLFQNGEVSAPASTSSQPSASDSDARTKQASEAQAVKKGSSRSRRRQGRSSDKTSAASAPQSAASTAPSAPPAASAEPQALKAAPTAVAEQTQPAGTDAAIMKTEKSQDNGRGRRTRRRHSSKKETVAEQATNQEGIMGAQRPQDTPEKSQPSNATHSGGSNAVQPPADSASSSKPTPPKKPRRALYRAGRGSVSSAAREHARGHDD